MTVMNGAAMNYQQYFPYPDRRALRDAWVKLIDDDRWSYDRFVTLQFNDHRNRRLPAVGRDEHIRSVLRHVDACVNSAILAKNWAKSPDRTWGFFVPEKIEVSTHWHGLVRFSDDPVARLKQETRFDEVLTRTWAKVAPQGTVDVKTVKIQGGAVRYLCKSLPYELSFDHIVLPDDFFRG
jgi:hypothetical protein